MNPHEEVARLAAKLEEQTAIAESAWEKWKAATAEVEAMRDRAERAEGEAHATRIRSDDLRKALRFFVDGQFTTRTIDGVVYRLVAESDVEKRGRRALEGSDR